MYETTLFAARLRRQSPEEVSSFMHRHGLDFKPVDEDEKRTYEKELEQVFDAVEVTDTGEVEKETFEQVKFFKVPFLQVCFAGWWSPLTSPQHPRCPPALRAHSLTPDPPLSPHNTHPPKAMELVRQRRVYLHAGFAYVPRGRIIAIIANRFR